MCVWVAVFGLSGYKYDSGLFGLFNILTLPYFIVNFFFGFVGDYSYFPMLNAIMTAVAALTITITRAAIKKRLRFDWKTVLLLAVFACLCGIAGFQHYDRSTKFLDHDPFAERVGDEIDYRSYLPFKGEDGINSNLERLDEPPDITFTEDYPRLDGATAAYPVYAAMVQELYQGLDEKTVRDYIACSKTDEAYQRLIDGEIDIFFGAQPSREQMEAAKANGVELVLTPIAREAFVFFVNKENPVAGLSVGQIQDIYQKKIVNWSEVGGKDEAIMPFQRPEGSGSQTIMLAKVMGDKPLPAPLLEEYSYGMGGVVSLVATYRNYSSAIGYSFRYYAIGMHPNDNIKLLSINGIKPTPISIRNGAYPFSIDVYAVTTAGSAEGNAGKLIEWALSEQGQDFIKKCGYVKLPPAPPEEEPVEEAPDLAEWERVMADWPMDFGFSDSTGTRFLMEHNVPYGELMEGGFDPEMYSLILGGHCEVATVAFDAWRAGTVDNSVPHFDRQPGFVYNAVDKVLSTNRTYMLCPPGPLSDALIPLSQPSVDPYSINPVDTEIVERIEAIKDRGVDLSTVLAKTEDGGQICLIVYEPAGEEALLSIVYVDEDKILFWDDKGYYNEEDDECMWRVDTYGPGYFDVMFLAQFDEGLMLMLNWGAFEGEAVTLLFEKDGEFVRLDRGLYYRYMPWMHDQ